MKKFYSASIWCNFSNIAYFWGAWAPLACSGLISASAPRDYTEWSLGDPQGTGDQTRRDISPTELSLRLLI